MSDRDIQPYDWFKRFFGSGFGMDMFRAFDEMQREMQRLSEQFNDFQSTAPKELIREYETKEGDKVREVGPIVYGYSMTIGPDGKPHIREFGNLRPFGKGMMGKRGGGFGSSASGFGFGPEITAEREPLSDVTTTDKEVKVVLEMPGIKKEDIKINAYDSQIEILTADASQRKYHKTIELPEQADIETARSTYNNGILEVTFDKKNESKPQGKQIKID
jgi:HSP20 family protein